MPLASTTTVVSKARAERLHGLVDEYRLLVSPILRGRGTKLFADAPAQIDLKVEEVKLLSGGMLALHMVPAA